MADVQDRYDNPTSRDAALSSDVGVSDGYVEGGRRVEANHAWHWIAEGWRYFRRQPGLWVILTLIFGAFLMALKFVPVIGPLATILLVPVLAAGLISGCQTIERGGELELAHLFLGFRHNTGQLVLVGLIGFALTFAVMVPAVLLMGPSVFMAVMGGGGATMVSMAGALGLLIALALFVPVNMALWFAPALVILQGQSAPRAIAESFRGCLKNIVPFLIYGIALFVLAMLASIPLGLGWLVLGPVVIGSVYAAYRDIYGAARVSEP
jgi:uncharacterized membrane protein